MTPRVNTQPQLKRYKDICFPQSFRQLTEELQRTAERTKTHIDQILTDSPVKMNRSGVIKIG